MVRQLAVEGLPAQAEDSRGGGFVARDRAKRANDVLAFDVHQPPATRSPCTRWTVSELVGKIVECDARTRAEDQRALDHILKFSHVPGPAVPAKHGHHVV